MAKQLRRLSQMVLIRLKKWNQSSTTWEFVKNKYYADAKMFIMIPLRLLKSLMQR